MKKKIFFISLYFLSQNLAVAYKKSPQPNEGRGLGKKYLATTYSATPVQMQYHRHNGA